MKKFVFQFEKLFKLRNFKASFFFTMLFAASTMMNAAVNSDHYNYSIIEHEGIKMSVTPNPIGENQATVELYSESKEATIVIFNSMGIVVLEDSFAVEKDTENSIQLDLSQLETGIYYILHNETSDSTTYSVR